MLVKHEKRPLGRLTYVSRPVLANLVYISVYPESLACKTHPQQADVLREPRYCFANNLRPTHHHQHLRYVFAAGKDHSHP